MSRILRIATALLALPALAGACAESLAPRFCTRELRFDVTPDEPVLRVGGSLTPAVQLSTCGGDVRVEDRFTWRVADPAVATVDASTGRLTGITRGRTTAEATGARYGVVVSVAVTVE